MLWSFMIKSWPYLYALTPILTLSLLLSCLTSPEHNPLRQDVNVNSLFSFTCSESSSVWDPETAGREATTSAAEMVLLEDERRWSFGGFLNRIVLKWISSILPFCHPTIVMPYPPCPGVFLLLSSFLWPAAPSKWLHAQCDNRQLIMGQSDQIKEGYLTNDLTVCYLCPPTHAILSPFPSSFLSDMLVHPSPFSHLLPLWLVRSQDKERGWKESKKKEKSRGQEVTKKEERRCNLWGSSSLSLHMCTPLCCRLARWDFIKSAQLSKCAILAKMNRELKYMEARHLKPHWINHVNNWCCAAKITKANLTFGDQTLHLKIPLHNK